MAKHRTRVGLHARNDVRFTEPDYNLIRTARIETIKMMSFTDTAVFERLRRENDGVEFIVRLYDDRIHRGSYPTPSAFVAKMVPVVQRLRAYADKFEIHNEPNHVDGIEGWGASDENARSFRDWYLKVLPALKKACPWAKFGFPGLALNHPHRDLAWLDICRKAILASDWLGCHTYWQYDNMLNDDWGLRFTLYHKRFPNMRIEITEFGNSTPNLPREKVAEQYARYYQELNKYPYLGSASAFIASSPDPAWALFVWMKDGGEMLPVVRATRDMPRTAVEIPPPPPKPRPKPKPKPKPKPPVPAERHYPQTGKTVRGSFLKFLEKYGLAICGYPITEQMEEDGVPTQYFQRLGLKEPKPGKIELQLVGTEAWLSRDRLAKLGSQINELKKRAVSGTMVVKPAIMDIVSELQRHPDKQYPTRTLSDINRIVIHHTGTSPSITAGQLALYEVGKGKPAVSYHFFVAEDGTIFKTNNLQTVTDHAFTHSWDCVGVCLAGNFAGSNPTKDQLQASAALCAWLLDRLHLPTEAIIGLNELVSAQSPGPQWLGDKRWKEELLVSVAALMETETEDPSTLVAALNKRILVLDAEIERLERKSPSDPGRTLPHEIIERLTDLVTSLQIQVQVLQTEFSKTEMGSRGPGEDWISYVTDSAQVGAQVEDELQPQDETDGDPEINDAKLAIFITMLQDKITSLQKELEQLKAAPPAESPPTGLPEVGQPPIQDLTGTLYTHATEEYETRSRSDIRTLVIHHSAAPPSVGPQRIAAYHVNRHDWPGVGYHFLIGDDGTIYQANTVETVSYHAAKVNPRGIGICFLGNFTEKVPPPAQLLAGAHLIAWLTQELDIEPDEVKGHKELMGTACPGSQWLEGKHWKQMLQQEIVRLQHEGQPDPLPIMTNKGMEHYVLFWARDGDWAQADWRNAQGYIAAFRPSVGFSADDASLAEYVTIVGGSLGVPLKVEYQLREQGCRVDRIAGKNEDETRKMLDTLVSKGERFWGFEG